VAFAFADPAVRVVRAHTISANAASIGVLRRCRFHFVGDVVEPDDGLVLRWERFRPASRAPERVVTPRMVLAPPRSADARDIFKRYASDPDVTRYLSWRTHRVVDDTDAFVAFAISEWAQKPVGPYLMRDRETRRLLGSTGLMLDTPGRAMTGYVLAQGAWGAGLATEALRAMVGVARAIGIREVAALCHANHVASIRVLEKAGFTRDAVPALPLVFPNLQEDAPQPVLRYSRGLD
jgi:RimJ/RimL family protein N-acetyltransferase